MHFTVKYLWQRGLMFAIMVDFPVADAWQAQTPGSRQCHTKLNIPMNYQVIFLPDSHEFLLKGGF
jgi:hypothetical protein